MKVEDLLAMAKLRCPNVPVSKNADIVINIVNLGIAELYRKFNLKVKSETVLTTTDLALYTLRNDDVELILFLYDKFGRELQSSDVLDSLHYDYKLVNYNSFLLRKPFDGYVYVVYKASPIKVVDANDHIDLPDCMIDTLMSYILYALTSTINTDQKNEANAYYLLFNQQCQELINQGYKVSLTSESAAVQVKGYV